MDAVQTVNVLLRVNAGAGGGVDDVGKKAEVFIIAECGSRKSELLGDLADGISFFLIHKKSFRVLTAAAPL